jgi:type I restriction enzyme S subunit
MSVTTARLGDLATFLSGFAFKSAKFNKDKLGHPLIRIRDVTGGTTQTYYTGSYDPRYLVNTGDYIIGMDGEFNLAKWHGEPALLNQRVCKIEKVSGSLDKDYLARYLAIVLKRIEATTPFVTVKHLSVKTLNDIGIPLPPIREQRKIAQVLDGVDALRTKRLKAVSLLNSLTQSIFVDMFGDPARNPMNWNVVRIGDLLESAKYGTSEKSDTQGTVPVLRMNNITSGGEIDLQNLKYMPHEIRDERYEVKKGDILFNRTNSPDLVGKSAIYRGDSVMSYAGYLVRARTNVRSDPEYIAAFLNSRYAKKTLRSMCKSIVGMANINAREMQEIKIPEPEIGLQQEFARRVQVVESMKVAHRSHLSELNTLFASIQNRAFRGELWDTPAT